MPVVLDLLARLTTCGKTKPFLYGPSLGSPNPNRVALAENLNVPGF